MSSRSLLLSQGPRLLAIATLAASALLPAGQASACPLCQANYFTTHSADTLGPAPPSGPGGPLNLTSNPAGGYHIGLDFLTANVDPGDSFLFDFQPYTLTAPGNNFVAQGAFAGRTESEVQRRIALAVEDAFRTIPGLPANQISTIAIHLGPVPTNVAGRRLNIALGQSSSPIWTLLGEALQNGYNAGNIPNDSYAAAAYLDEIDKLGNGFVTYNTFDGAINSIAGTIAHEAGHVFGAEHVTITGNEPGPLPLMAIEPTGLPTSARLTVRQFDLLPQYTPPNATRILNNADTVLQGDYNLDGLVDAADIGVLLAGFGQDDRLMIEGDATGDHRVDAADIGRILANWSNPPTLPAARLMLAAVPEPATAALVAPLLLAAHGAIRRRLRPSTRQPR